MVNVKDSATGTTLVEKTIYVVSRHGFPDTVHENVILAANEFVRVMHATDKPAPAPTATKKKGRK